MGMAENSLVVNQKEEGCSKKNSLPPYKAYIVIRIS
jgi:hypothetical protein